MAAMAIIAIAMAAAQVFRSAGGAPRRRVSDDIVCTFSGQYHRTHNRSALPRDRRWPLARRDDAARGAGWQAARTPARQRAQC
jgi:hypothetical protein